MKSRGVKEAYREKNEG
jgi:hypothetical protein